ncbi:MAG TPA: hypothetical protein VIF57_00805 [Polyangia bacterium]|jgi:hypothetical protein
MALVFASGACGGSGSSRPVCQPDSLGSSSGAAAAESALIARGRADADFGHALGADSGNLLDAGDAARAALLAQAAAAAGIVLPAAGTPTTTCATPTATVKRGAIFTLTAHAFILAAGLLNLAATGVPLNGMTPHAPMIKTDSGTAADGSPTQTVTMIDTSFGGHDSTAVVTLTMSTAINNGDKWTTEAVTINATVNVCPDAGGTAPGTFDMTVDGAAGSGTNAGSTYHGEVHDSFAFMVNDAAQVSSTVDMSAVIYHATGARSADASVHATATLTDGSVSQTTAPVVDQDDGSADSAQVVRQCLYTFGIYTAGLVQSTATSKWRGGACVEVHVNPGSEMVDKNAQVMLTAQPFQKIEQANFNAAVVATLTGVQSVSPQGQPVAAPAMFTYVAGSKFKDQGVVSLKSTSKRGIGTGSATYTVKCDETMMCPEGQKLNLETCMCECAMTQTCPAGSVWDDKSCMCVCAPKACAGGQTWDAQTCQCVCNMQCPPGKTLNMELCECEASCQIDPTSGFPPPTCVWVGTAHVSASEGGQLDRPSDPDLTDRVTWSLSYDASLNVSELSATQVHNLGGSVNGRYTEVEVLTSPQCTSTITSDYSIAQTADQGTLAVLPQGGGTYMLYIDVGGTYMGPFTIMGSGSSCSPDSMETSGVGFGNFFAYGTASGSTFSGSEDDAAPTDVTLPNGETAKYRLSWSLRLVQR